MSSDQARELRQQGIVAAKAGQKDKARQLLQQSLRVEPDNEAAWLWLASVARDDRERLFCLNKVLEINPQNEQALKAVRGANAPAPSIGVKRITTTTPAIVEPPVARGDTPAPFAAPPDPLNQAPGVPMPGPDRITDAQQKADALVRDYITPLPANVQYTRKTSRRAGERDVLYLRLYILAGVVGFIVLLIGAGLVLVATNADVQALVLAPTWTPTYTATPTNTPTPGLTPTPSVTPRVTVTPSPTVPGSIPTRNPLVLPEPTDIYPRPDNREIADVAVAISQGDYARPLPTLQVERQRTFDTLFCPVPYYYTALALIGRGDTDEALSIMEEAEERLSERPTEINTLKPLVDNGFVHVYWQLAQEALADGDSTRAGEYYALMNERAADTIDSDPRLEAPYLYLARYHIQQEAYDEAIRVLDQGLAVNDLSTNLNLIVTKGEAYFAQGEYDLANYEAFLALYIDPNTEAAHQLRVRTALAEDEPGQAVLYAQDYLFYYPGSRLAWKLLGDARAAEGNAELALLAYSQGVQGGEPRPAELGTTVEMLLARAAIYEAQRRYDLAREDYTTAFDLTEDETHLARRMVAAYAEGRYQIALDDADELLGRGIVPDAQIELIQARILIDDAEEDDRQAFNQALGLLQRVSASTDLSREEQATAQEYLARAHLGLENLSDALTAIDAALASGETGSRRFVRGQILEAQDEIDAARAEYERVLAWSQIFPYPFRGEVEERLEGLS